MISLPPSAAREALCHAHGGGCCARYLYFDALSPSLGLMLTLWSYLHMYKIARLRCTFSRSLFLTLLLCRRGEVGQRLSSSLASIALPPFLVRHRPLSSMPCHAMPDFRLFWHHLFLCVCPAAVSCVSSLASVKYCTERARATKSQKLALFFFKRFMLNSK